MPNHLKHLKYGPHYNKYNNIEIFVKSLFLNDDKFKEFYNNRKKHSFYHVIAFLACHINNCPTIVNQNQCYNRSCDKDWRLESLKS